MRRSNLHQGTNVEITVVQKLYQGVCTDVSSPHPCLIFSLFLSFASRQKKVNREQKEMNKGKLRGVEKLNKFQNAEVSDTTDDDQRIKSSSHKKYFQKIESSFEA